MAFRLFGWVRETLRRSRFAGPVARSWLALTSDEQRAIALILSLFLLGIAVRGCHPRAVPPTESSPTPVEKISRPPHQTKTQSKSLPRSPDSI